MHLTDLSDALVAVTAKTYHGAAPGDVTGAYIVWAEDGQADAVHGDNQMLIQVLTGTIDLYTQTEFDPLMQTVQAALNVLGIGWRLNSIQYEDGTGYWHYEWVWEMAVEP